MRRRNGVSLLTALVMKIVQRREWLTGTCEERWLEPQKGETFIRLGDRAHSLGYLAMQHRDPRRQPSHCALMEQTHLASLEPHRPI